LNIFLGSKSIKSFKNN